MYCTTCTKCIYNTYVPTYVDKGKYGLRFHQEMMDGNLIHANGIVGLFYCLVFGPVKMILICQKLRYDRNIAKSRFLQLKLIVSNEFRKTKV